MINQHKWIKSLPKTNTKINEKENQADSSRWVNTIPQKNIHNGVAAYNNSAWKYSLVAVIFVSGLLLVSAIKNETRNLEKEINNLRTSNKAIKFNLDQAILDNEVITAPENISRLAKEYLNTDFVSYKKSQLKPLYGDTKNISKLNKSNNIIIAKAKEKNNYLSTKIKSVIKKKIEKKKTEIRKLQELYSKPTTIPTEVKTQIASKIKKKKD